MGLHLMEIFKSRNWYFWKLLAELRLHALQPLNTLCHTSCSQCTVWEKTGRILIKQPHILCLCKQLHLIFTPVINKFPTFMRNHYMYPKHPTTRFWREPAESSVHFSLLKFNFNITSKLYLGPPHAF
jgi:hypothetical protein